MNATVLDLRNNMKNILSAIDRRENITLTYRGHKKAVITPYSEHNKTPTVAKHPAFGMWKNNEAMANPTEYVRSLRTGRKFR